VGPNEQMKAEAARKHGAERHESEDYAWMHVGPQHVHEGQGVDPASSLEAVGVEGVGGEAETEHEDEIGPLHEAIANHGKTGEENGRGDPGAQPVIGRGLLRQGGVLEKDPEGQRHRGRLEEDDAGQSRGAEDQIQHHVEQPLRVVIGERDAGKSERLVQRQASALDHEAAEGEVGPGVGIFDPGDGEGEGRRRHQDAEHPRARAQGHVEWLEPLDDGADALPEADAHGLEPIALLAALELVEQRVHEPRP